MFNVDGTVLNSDQRRRFKLSIQLPAAKAGLADRHHLDSDFQIQPRAVRCVDGVAPIASERETGPVAKGKPKPLGAFLQAALDAATASSSSAPALTWSREGIWCVHAQAHAAHRRSDLPQGAGDGLLLRRQDGLYRTADRRRHALLPGAPAAFRKEPVPRHAQGAVRGQRGTVPGARHPYPLGLVGAPPGAASRLQRRRLPRPERFAPESGGATERHRTPCAGDGEQCRSRAPSASCWKRCTTRRASAWWC